MPNIIKILTKRNFDNFFWKFTFLCYMKNNLWHASCDLIKNFHFNNQAMIQIHFQFQSRELKFRQVFALKWNLRKWKESWNIQKQKKNLMPYQFVKPWLFTGHAAHLYNFSWCNLHRFSFNLHFRAYFILFLPQNSLSIRDKIFESR